MDIPTTAFCSCCGTVKSIDQFKSRDPKNFKYNFVRHCIDCKTEYMRNYMRKYLADYEKRKVVNAQQRERKLLKVQEMSLAAGTCFDVSAPNNDV